MVTIASFQDYVQASIAKSKLDSVGIDTWMADDIMITLDWFYSRLLGGVKLRVRERDAKEARLVLEEAVPSASGEDAEHETEPVSSFARARRLIFIVLAAGYILPLLIQGVYYLRLILTGA